MENSEEKPPKKYRIGNLGAAIFWAAAGIADLITLIPLAGDIVGPLFWVLSAIYLWKSGLGLLNARRLATMSLSLVAELIPAVQELPAILAGAVIIVMFSRFEDKTGISVPISGKKPGTTLPRNRPRPKNITPNVRPPNNIVRLNQDEFDKAA